MENNTNQDRRRRLIIRSYLFLLIYLFLSLDPGMEDENPSAECEACTESIKEGQVMGPDDAMSTGAVSVTT